MCKAVKIARSSFHYSRKSEVCRHLKDKEVLEAIMCLNPRDIRKAGSKRKSQLLKKTGKIVNHKRVARICREYNLNDTVIHSDQGEVYQDKTYRSFFKRNVENDENANKNSKLTKAKKYDKRYEEAIKQAKDLNLVQSMSRRGNCWDNACMERFFGTVKSETNYYDTLKNGLLSYKEMERMIREFIEYYNNQRIQKGLNWMTPVEFRSKKCY